MTPTGLSLALLRKAGYAVDIVERWLKIPGKNVRRDLFHCIDLIAVRSGESGVLGVQVTSLANVSTRIVKAKQQPELRTWLAAGNRFEVHGWTKRAGRWRVKRVAIHGTDLAETVIVQPPRRNGGIGHRQGTLFG